MRRIMVMLGVGAAGAAYWYARRRIHRALKPAEPTLVAVSHAPPPPVDHLVPADTPWHGTTITTQSELIELERALLTVPGLPGENHRRRDQTSGRAAREIAAAQVRQRRNGCVPRTHGRGFDPRAY